MAEVWLEPTARETISVEAAKRRLLETGGPLFGYEVDRGLVVVRALGPGPRTRHHRRRLVPHPGDTQVIIDAVFEESKGQLRYLGDWHTHPQGRAFPSGTDVESAGAIAVDGDVGIERPLVLIQSTRPLRAHVGIRSLNAFRWDPERSDLVRQILTVAACQ